VVIVGLVDLRQLAAFDAVAAELHFARAAARLDISQPAVSQLVRRLERSLSVSLFDRSSHHVALTSAGAELLPLARRTLAAAGELTDAAAGISSGGAGRLRIGTTPGIGPSLNLLLASFRARHPRVSVDLDTPATDRKLAALKAGDLDLAFVRAPVRDGGLRTQLLWRERMLAVIPVSHEAAAGDVADPSRLTTLPLILLDRRTNPAMHDEILDLCRASGVEPTLGPPLRELQEGEALVATGAGWFLTAEANAPHGVRGVAVRRLPEPEPETRVSLVWRGAGPSAQAAAFIAVAREAAEAGRLPALSHGAGA
jgi:DNA-binding transcriptional LysR family regulator